MKALLVRVGIDHSFGHWNAPVDPKSLDFLYIPIPEASKETFQKGLRRSYEEVLPCIDSFVNAHRRILQRKVVLPGALTRKAMHLDPDFREFTYGDVGDRRGARIKEMQQGDLIVFYAGLRPITEYEFPLLYALVGLYVVDEVVLAKDVPEKRCHENAHTRRTKVAPSDIVVRAAQGVSGRFDRCIPVGEYRNRAYRVKREVLEAWGGLSVNDGYIQRSAVPPWFLKPEEFYRWFVAQKVKLLGRNN